MNYGWRFVTLYRTQGSRPFTRKRNTEKQNGSLRRAYKCLESGAVISKGEWERYTHLNAEFQRITRRDKKAFLSDQSKETEENNRMKKIRDLYKTTGDT